MDSEIVTDAEKAILKAIEAVGELPENENYTEAAKHLGIALTLVKATKKEG